MLQGGAGAGGNHQSSVFTLCGVGERASPGLAGERPLGMGSVEDHRDALGLT